MAASSLLQVARGDRARRSGPVARRSGPGPPRFKRDSQFRLSWAYVYRKGKGKRGIQGVAEERKTDDETQGEKNVRKREGSKMQDQTEPGSEREPHRRRRNDRPTLGDCEAKSTPTDPSRPLASTS